MESEILQLIKKNPEKVKEFKDYIKEESEDEGKKKTQADLLTEACSNNIVELFHDANKEANAKIIINGVNQIHELKSRFFKLWLRKQAHDIYNMLPNDDAIKKVVGRFEAQAVFDGKKYILHNRIAAHEGAIFYDHCNEKWQSTKITTKGSEIINNPPILFKRFNHQQAQVLPDNDGDISLIFKYFNVKENSRLLLLVYIVSLFIPQIPHTIAVLYGERGAAKTTSSKMIKRLVDPSSVEAMTFPKDLNELVQKLSHHWLIPFDNITLINDWQSDALCRAVTGEGLSKRKLFTDDEDIIYSFKRCIILNGINCVASREDLLDRCLLFELERIPESKRREDLKVWAEFEKDRPKILAGIFDTLSKTLSIYPTVKLNQLFRMADFTRWGYAIAEALGRRGDDFLDLYSENIERQNEEAINRNPVATATVAFMRDKEEWEGTASSLLSKLEEVAAREKIDIRSKSFPKAANILVRRLNQVKSNLLDADIAYTQKYTSRGSMISFLNTKKNTSTISIPPQMAINQALSNEDTVEVLNKSGDTHKYNGGTYKGSEDTIKIPSSLEITNTKACGDSGGSEDKIPTYKNDDDLPDWVREAQEVL